VQAGMGLVLSWAIHDTYLYGDLQIVMQLPEHRKNVFLYLCAFLQEVLNHASKNGLDAKTLGMLLDATEVASNLCIIVAATLFGAIFLRDLPRSGGAARTRSSQQANDRKKANFVYHFLVNNQSDFILGH
jgi:phosphatidylinositol-bisphosphatase